jgi:hypothetical protein
MTATTVTKTIKFTHMGTTGLEGEDQGSGNAAAHPGVNAIQHFATVIYEFS